MAAVIIASGCRSSIVLQSVQLRLGRLIAFDGLQIVFDARGLGTFADAPAPSRPRTGSRASS